LEESTCSAGEEVRVILESMLSYQVEKKKNPKGKKKKKKKLSVIAQLVESFSCWVKRTRRFNHERQC